MLKFQKKQDGKQQNNTVEDGPKTELKCPAEDEGIEESLGPKRSTNEEEDDEPPVTFFVNSICN